MPIQSHPLRLMAYQLADYQQSVKNDCIKAWDDGYQNVAPVIPTGGGKTVLMGNIGHEFDGYGCAIAHRAELVSQISLALAREGLRHDIVGPKKLQQNISRLHLDKIGANYFNPRSKWKVASVDTLIRRALDDNWCRQVGMVFEDEAHHVGPWNKWGKALELFPNAKALLPTATPERADRKPLARHAGGLIDVLVEGPSMKWMIENGHLTPYKLYMPTPKDFDMQGVDISATTGDYNADQTRKRVKGCQSIIGSVVDSYKQFAMGKRGLTFAVDIEHATDIAKAFNAAGVPAVVVHADTPDLERDSVMRKLEARELLQVVNVDLFGEGVDVPCVEVISFARPTMSYGLFVQMFGRALRLLVSPILRAAWHTYSADQRRMHIEMSEKPHAIVIDHVGNIITHGGPPDWRTAPWNWEGGNKGRANDGIPLRACANSMCLQPFERIYPACPYCGWEPPLPADRSLPKHVDGDIILYTPEMLAELFGAKAAIDGPAPETFGGAIGQSIINRHYNRQAVQRQLREVMALAMPTNRDPRINQRKFFHEFKIDTLTAMTLGSTEAEALRQRIIEKVTGK